MVSSLSHFSNAVGFKDKDGPCSEGLIDQNNCASICLLKAERTTASQRWYFQLSQPLMLLTWLILMCWWTALQVKSAVETSLKREERGYWCAGAKKEREGGAPRTEKECVIYSTHAVKDVKWYPRLSVPSFSAGNCNVLDDIQFTVMAAALPWWHQWSDDRRLQLRCHLSVHQVFAYFSPNVLFISGTIFPREIINFMSAGIKSQ